MEAHAQIDLYNKKMFHVLKQGPEEGRQQN
jgi:hypothetical protein